MHDSPSSPRRSIAPAPPKQQHAKKSGAPKAKGAVRAKSGCYTCRIRRKKCDERPNTEGRCETCIRLRLQCLGFGQKRPDWLKENNNVTAFREKIKDFLAAQGMIKGHSGSGARSSDQEGMLVLMSDHGRSDTSSPHSPALSVDSSEDRRHNGHNVSNIRSHYPSISLPAQLSHPGYSSQRHHSNQNPYTSYTAPPGPVAPPPTLPVPSQAPAPAPMPISQFTSTLSPSYHQQYVYEEEEFNDAEQLHSGYYIESSLSHSIAPSVTSHQNGLVRHYLDHVLQRQYLLADKKSISEFIIRTVQQSPAVRDAVCLLASLHQESLRQGNPSAVQASALVPHSEPSADWRRTYKRICESLRASTAVNYTEGEAMAGLFVVSAFLFQGGRGAWEHFLAVAAAWVWNVLDTGEDPNGTILRCSDSQQFVIKTTFWFDILASTTRLEPPRFLEFYRKLWAPQHAYIEGVAGSSSGGTGARSESPQMSMLSVMGCENQTALAIAEISALACWKAMHERQGTLSVPDLVDRGRRIDTECLQQHPLPPGGIFYPAGGTDDLPAKRQLTAEIFRATARVYLHSVLSGENPGCPEIREGVRETIDCLQRVPAGGGGQSTSVARSVLRSVVFGICLCGCLADDPQEREFLLRRLDAEEQAEGVGNCASARLVMQEVWNRRAPGHAEGSLTWRDATQMFGGESLLLV
ncbi:fungal-specific transcription factor domain-containing protein [Russula brevipes]|nr:fungal-specific transcription factor domain-containing protein [Russula brevipes]